MQLSVMASVMRFGPAYRACSGRKTGCRGRNLAAISLATQPLPTVRVTDLRCRGLVFVRAAGSGAHLFDTIGYLDHSADTVRLYLQESFTFRVLSDEAVVPLSYRAT